MRLRFTLIEMLVVVVILGIAAAISIPMMGSAGSVQIRSAANEIAADIEYAKSMAISHGQCYSIVFDSSTESYEILRESGGSLVSIDHPVKRGFDYVIEFGAGSGLDNVEITSADFDTSSTVTFDYLGSPYSGTGTTSPLNSGSIVLSGGSETITVNVEAVTGYVSISD